MIDLSRPQYLSIICDTCIFIDLTREHMRLPLLNFMVELNNNHNLFYFSQYSIFELFRGQPKKIEQDYRVLLRPYRPIPINENTLFKASDLMCAYKHNRIISDASTSKIKSENRIDDGDYIIGATAFQYKNTCILTRNFSDFPRPFFTEIHKRYIKYNYKEKEGWEVYYILQPDIYYENKIYHARD